MSQSATESLPSFIPPRIDDPAALPIVPDQENLRALDEWRISASAMRERFLSPPVWQPEFNGDGLRFRPGPPRDAAVLVPIIVHDSGNTVLLTQRTAHLSQHAGQIAFPGGRRDPEDLSAISTALRETEEEVGLSRDRIEVIGELPDYLTGTGYRVRPVVGLIKPGFELRPEPGEVASVFEVPLAFLMNPSHHQRRLWHREGVDRTFYAMPYHSPADGGEYFIWGATAAMLRNLYRFLSA